MIVLTKSAVVLTSSVVVLTSIIVAGSIVVLTKHTHWFNTNGAVPARRNAPIAYDRADYRGCGADYKGCSADKPRTRFNTNGAVPARRNAPDGYEYRLNGDCDCPASDTDEVSCSP